MSVVLSKSAAAEFLSAFNYTKITVALIPDRKEKCQPLSSDNVYSAGTSKSAVSKTTLSVAADDFLTIHPELKAAQSKGWGVFFMVNEGDGLASGPDNPNCRSAKNVKNLTACFIDIDVEQDPPVFPPDLQPHFVVESSPRKYHCYWLLSPEQATRDNSRRWKAIQTALGTQFKADILTDTPRILRIPGYLHLKGTPFQTKVLTRNDIPYYTLNTLFELTSAKDFYQTKTSAPLPEVTETTLVPKGDRHKRILSEAAKRFYKGDSFEEVRCFMDGFIQRHVTNPEDYQPGGAEHYDLERILKSAQTHSITQQTEQTLEVLDRPTQTDPFELPSEFYLNAPGLVGDITRSICAAARYPIPSHTFALAAAVVGTLKARYAVTENGGSPSNYFLCLAPSGGGKNFPQEILLGALNTLGLSRLAMNGIRSDKGILNLLEQNDSLGLLLLDEAKSFFSTLKDPNSPPYLKAVRYQLTDLYTSTRKTVNYGLTGNRKEKAYILHQPKLSFVGFAQPNLIETAFTSQFIIEGFLPRFLVFLKSTRSENPNPNTNYTLPSSIFDRLRSLQAIAALQHEDELEIAADSQELKPKNLVKHIYTPEARAIYRKAQEQFNAAYAKEVEKRSGLEALYSRALEQIDRLSLALTEADTIEAPTVEYCLKLITNQTNALASHVSESLDVAYQNTEADKLKTLLERMYFESKAPIRIRDLQLAARFLSADAFRKCLQSLESLEVLKILEVKAGNGRLMKVCIPVILD